MLIEFDSVDEHDRFNANGELVKNFPGIISLHNTRRISEFDFVWQDALMPLDRYGYSIIDQAVTECAFAGVNSIWIVCSESHHPVLRKHLGDHTQDPRSYYRKGQHNPSYIPIYYVPVFSRDRGKRDSHAWTMFHGARIARFCFNKFAYTKAPEFFYMCFPFTCFRTWYLDPYRGKLIQKNANPKMSFIRHKGKSALDGLPLPFTISWSHVSTILKEVAKEEKLFYQNKSFKKLAMQQLLSKTSLEDYYVVDIEEYTEIVDWWTYKEIIAAPRAKSPRGWKYCSETREYIGLGNDIE